MGLLLPEAIENLREARKAWPLARAAGGSMGALLAESALHAPNLDFLRASCRLGQLLQRQNDWAERTLSPSS